LVVHKNLDKAIMKKAKKGEDPFLRSFRTYIAESLLMT
jgi:hypothetical protein